MHPDKNEQQTLHELMLENQRLLHENHQLLQKMNRRSVLGFWIRMLWFAFLLGLPFVLYYYVVEPYFTSLGSSFETFQEGLQEVPGWKRFYEAASGDGEGDSGE
jgi:hypothetical protein